MKTELPEVRVAFSTAPSREVAETIARGLVEERLAACVNIVPNLQSVYSWEGKLCVDSEVLMIIKTNKTRMESLEARLKELHPYKVPEFVVLPALHVSAAYHEWLSTLLG